MKRVFLKTSREKPSSKFYLHNLMISPSIVKKNSKPTSNCQTKQREKKKSNWKKKFDVTLTDFYCSLSHTHTDTSNKKIDEKNKN